MFARVATFEGGDVAQLREINEQRMRDGTMNLPDGLLRALVLHGENNNRLFITFFDTRESLQAAAQRFEQMGDEIPEDIRGRRVDVSTYEVVMDEQRSG